MEEQLLSSWNKLLTKLSGWVDGVVTGLPNLLIAITVFVLAYFLSRRLKKWANKALTNIIHQPAIRGLLASLVSVVTIIIGLLLALSVLNLDDTLKTLLAGAGVAGLAISLALQGTLSNIFSGVFIAIKDDISIGDWLDTNGYSGKVMNIDLRNTRIKESDNNIVVLPNKLILDNPFKNYALTTRIRSTINCGVGYESDLEEVKKIAVKAIEDIFPTKNGEKVEFYYTNFGDSAIDFILRFWVDGTESVTSTLVKSKAIMAIKKAFDQNDINIPFPIRTIINK